MRVKKHKQIVWWLLVATTLISTSPKVLAQTSDSLNLTTSPLPISLVAQPGKAVTTDLRVKNAGAKTESLKIDLYKFRAYGDTGKPQIIDREPGDDYFDWVSFSQKTFTAEPNVWKTIKMTVNVPKSAAFGFHGPIRPRPRPPGPRPSSAAAPL
jgi:hypothetical protein